MSTAVANSPSFETKKTLNPCSLHALRFSNPSTYAKE
jgi:hypothetical protein